MEPNAIPDEAHRAIAELQPVLLILVRTIVDKPDAVQILVKTSPEETEFTIRVDDKDIGKVIGNNGRNAKSLRTLLSAAAMKYKHRIKLDIPASNETPGYISGRETFGKGPRSQA